MLFQLSLEGWQLYEWGSQIYNVSRDVTTPISSWLCGDDASGTFELADEEAEEIYEVINVGKIKAHTPNLRVVNLYGISFVDDTHVELLSSNCIHLESLALNFCLRVKGSTLKVLIQRCKKLKALLMQHCGMCMLYNCLEWYKWVLTNLYNVEPG